MKDRKTGEEIKPFGYLLTAVGRPLREKVDTSRAGDYGADPIGDGMFRMVPSGAVVGLEERNRRLQRRS